MAPLDRKEVTGSHGIWPALEAYGVRFAVQRSTGADAGEVIRTDFLVHRFFMELSRNAVLLRAWSTCSTRVRRVLSFPHRSYPDLQEIADSHLSFLPLIHAKDANRAAELMERHVHEACEDLMRRWTLPGAGEEATSGD